MLPKKFRARAQPCVYQVSYHSVATNHRITLYDLQLASGCTLSPFVWATKYALAHKGFEVDLVPGGFTGILERTGGRSERLPVIVDDGRWVLDSWLIADYLDQQYPDRPRLLADQSVKLLTQFLEGWLWRRAITPWFGCYIKDYRDLSFAQDHEYVTRSRENMLGRRIEDVQAGREDRLPLIPPTLEPLRQLLRESAWLGGEHPNYTDYRALAVFLWTAAIATTPPLTADDPLRDWLDRGFDLYGGLGRHAGMHTLFGLQLRPGDPEPFGREPPRGGLASRNTGPSSTRAETERMTRGAPAHQR
jgi:glutathione S-transferase